MGLLFHNKLISTRLRVPGLPLAPPRRPELVPEQVAVPVRGRSTRVRTKVLALALAMMPHRDRLPDGRCHLPAPPRRQPRRQKFDQRGRP